MGFGVVAACGGAVGYAGFSHFLHGETVIAKSRPSVQKRLHEANKLEKKQIKEARKARRQAELAERRANADGVDPDLAGIVAGPQPVVEDPLDRRPESERE
ncbi:MAG: hypothetical protein VX265_00065 [Myxococcota bacterium]|nr:hypothetical protein [Myxococcota bacterium]